VRETTPQTPRSVNKEGKTCSRSWSRESPAAPGKEHGELGCTLQPMKDHTRSDIHTATHGGPHARAGGCALKEAADPGEPMVEMKCYKLTTTLIPHLPMLLRGRRFGKEGAKMSLGRRF